MRWTVAGQGSRQLSSCADQQDRTCFSSSSMRKAACSDCISFFSNALRASSSAAAAFLGTRGDPLGDWSACGDGVGETVAAAWAALGLGFGDDGALAAGAAFFGRSAGKGRCDCRLPAWHRAPV